MHCLKIIFVGVACNLAAAAMANLGNAARDVNLNARSNVGDYLKARQDYEAFIAQKYSLSPRGVAPGAPAGEIVTVTVTGVPDYCIPHTATVVTTPVPVVVYTPQESVTSTPLKVETPFVPGTGIAVSSTLPTPPNAPGTAVSSVPTLFVGTNTTVSTSSLSGTKSSLASKVPGQSSSVPATSSTSVPTGAAIKKTSIDGLLLTILLAISGNAAFVL